MLSTSNRIHTLGLAPLFLRIGLGTLTVIHGWSRVSNPAAVMSIWQELRLPGPAVLGPGIEIAEFCAGILLVVGLMTRFSGLFLALAILVETLATKAPFTHVGGWALEWLSFWMALALVLLGAGFASLDGLLRRHR